MRKGRRSDGCEAVAWNQVNLLFLWPIAVCSPCH